jgi:hypothetical protein
MGRLLTRVNEQRNKDSFGDVSNRVYAALEKEIRERLTSEVRAEMQSELAQAKQSVAQAQAETIRVKAELQAEIHTIQKTHENDTRDDTKALLQLKEQNVQLKKDLFESQTAYKAREMDVKSMSVSLKSQMKEYEKGLEEIVSERTKLLESQQAAQQTIENYATERISLMENHHMETAGLLDELATVQKDFREVQATPPEPVKPPPPPPSPVIMPQPKIPEFTIGNIMRGHDSRIVSATISPVMTDD